LSAGRWDRRRLRRAAAAVLRKGLEAAHPGRLVERHLRVTEAGVLRAGGVSHRLSPRRRLVVVSAGKAAGAMAAAAENALGAHVTEALAVEAAESERLVRTRRLLAAHPVPDERSLAAADEVERLARSLGPDDVLLLLVSGGASALLAAPVPGISLDEKAAVTAALLRAGAGIGELNTVRKHLSRLKGGGLARLVAPALLVCLVLSDVVGDDLSTIASGPTVPDPTTYADAIRVLRARGVWDAAPASVRGHLLGGERGEVAETPKPGDAAFRRARSRVIGSNRWTLEAAAQEARRLGFRAVVLTSRLEGEAREVARALVAILRECAETGSPEVPPVCLVVGGETTVTVRGTGRGGRNQEMVVAMVEGLAPFPTHAVVASLATDGVDGMSHAAGGVADQETLARAAALGLAGPAAFLAHSDSTNFLGPLGDLIVTGPTGTNVVDLTVLLAGSRVRRRG
jgi:hydroxypyruvate reductase